MRKTSVLFTLVLFFVTMSVHAQNVFVNPGAGSYPTLKAAFDAVNAGLHTGTVTISIINNTNETAPASLNASGSGSANYTSVVISPTGGVRTISLGTVSGAVIKLNGADNVTIDGRIAGTGRNLIISNTNNSSSNAGIWLSSLGPGQGSTNNIIRNCEISCGSAQNISSFNTYGIITSGTILSTVNGEDNNNNQFLENRIIKSRYGIIVWGVGANTNDNNIISGNIIGPSSFGPDEIGLMGVYLQFQNNCTVSHNEIQFVGGPFGQTTVGFDRVGIGVGGSTWENNPTNTIGTNNNITGNIVHDIIDERINAAVGILISTTASGPPTNNTISNNVIYNIRSNGTSNSGNSAIGIGHSGERGDRIVFNSISMTGDMDPPGITSALQSASGIRIASVVDSGVTIKNNSVYVDITSNNLTLLHYCIIMPSASFTWASGSSDNNDYYHPPSNTQMRLGGLGTNTPFTPVATLPEWKSAFTPNQDANSISNDPLYNNVTSDLKPLNISPLKQAGTPIAGVTTDILGVSRSEVAPTIGAYEIASATLNLTVFIQGFYSSASNTMVSDTLTVYLRNTAFPYSVVDSAKALLSAAGFASFPFANVVDGVNYYIQLKHRNSIETWSAGGQSFSNSVLNYDFSAAASQAFGNNMIQVDNSPLRFAIYNGDVNQDGIVDASDLSLVDNDAFNSVAGYVNTDLNGDNFVDAADLSIADNNVFNGVIVQRP